MLELNKLQAYRESNIDIIKKKISELNTVSVQIMEEHDWYAITDFALLSHPSSKNQIANELKELREFYDSNDEFRFAAVCMFPNHVPIASDYLKNTKTAVVAVTGNFPYGATNLRNKLLETRYSIDEGANEIDYVMDLGNIIDEEFEKAFEEISAVKEVCKTIPLKVIIESGELPGLKHVRWASEIALHAGASFVKTSTGKTSNGASLEAAYVILQSIKSFHEETGEKRGIKVSGGISTKKAAADYVNLFTNFLGTDWLNSKGIRIGAGQLAKQMIKSRMNK